MNLAAIIIHRNASYTLSQAQHATVKKALGKEVGALRTKFHLDHKLALGPKTSHLGPRFHV